MKKKIYLKILLTVFISGLALSGYGQDSDLKKQKQQLRTHYRQTLQVDSAKAERVAQIQESYKTSMKLAMADSSLNDHTRRAKYQALMEEKNIQLRKFLSPAQQEKIIPHAERAVPAVKKD